MNFNKNLLSTLVSSILLTGAAHAAMSELTPKVVGFMPVIEFTGTKPAEVKLGDKVEFADTDFTFTDKDSDEEDVRNYIWKLDGNDVGEGLSYSIALADTESVGKNLTLVITPKTVSGDPREGNELVVDFGAIKVDETAKPEVSELAMSGTLQLGQKLGATYSFNPNGGDLTDASTFKWGHVGATASSVSSGSSVTTSGVVDDYELTSADVGEVVELSLQAKNALNVVGNTLTVTSEGLEGGGSGGQVVDPTKFAARIIFASTADDSVNGAGSTGRPVVGKDNMIAECKYEAAPEVDFSICDVSEEASYNLQWKGTLDGATYNDLSDGVNGASYMPHTNHQGQQIAVEVTVK
ncbi:hypothetical protein [Aeromonas enteropelogenes]|uniref:hypothetical protein n=1 Tax=Aeromonas enteropelogenes TaxID=29489 RepID=UPI003BA2A100